MPCDVWIGAGRRARGFSLRDADQKRRALGKSYYGYAPVGPRMVTADEVPNPQEVDLWLEVNGVRRQTGSTRTQIFGVAHVVSYLSRFMALQAGDVIATGTPPGVGLGKKPKPVFLKVGQTMALGIEGLGEQSQTVIAA